MNDISSKKLPLKYAFLDIKDIYKSEYSKFKADKNLDPKIIIEFEPDNVFKIANRISSNETNRKIASNLSSLEKTPELSKHSIFRHRDTALDTEENNQARNIYKREYKRFYVEGETLKQREKRLGLQKKLSRTREKLKLVEIRLNETAAEKEARIKYENEVLYNPKEIFIRKYIEKMGDSIDISLARDKALEELRRRKNEYHKKQRAKETPEEREERLKKSRAKYRKRLDDETPQQREERIRKQQKYYRTKIAPKRVTK